MKLEYARFSLAETVGANPKHRWTAFVPLCSALLLSHDLSFYLYIFKSFLAIATRTPFFSIAKFLRACLFFAPPPLEWKARKKIKGGRERFYGYMRACFVFDKKTTQGGRSCSIFTSALVYLFSFHYLLVDPVPICFSLSECHTKEILAGSLFFIPRETETGEKGEGGERMSLDVEDVDTYKFSPLKPMGLVCQPVDPLADA